MTDKQIIDEMIEKIGFDVQQCGYLKITKDAINYPEIGGTFTSFECNLYSRDCDFIERCRYKQLLRKEQELKNICKAFDIEYLIDKETGNLIYRCNKLYKKEQECEELKHKVELMMDCASCKVDEYKQTLAEIKEIAENVQSFVDINLEDDVYTEMNKILQKISECEVENE